MPTTIPKLPGIEGYHRCRCGELELEHVTWMTGGVCFECFLKDGYGPVREIEIGVQLARMKIHIPGPDTKQGTKGSKRTRGLIKRAQTRAHRRLKNLHPDEFDLLYDQERRKVGLEPIPRRVPHGWYNEVVKTYLDSVPYAAAEPGATDAANLTPDQGNR